MNINEIVDILNVDNSTKIQSIDIIYETRSSSSKYLDLDLAEKQGGKSWSSVFAGAQILRYRGKGKIYAKDIMEYFYRNDSSDTLKDKSISNKKLIKYAKMKNLIQLKNKVH